MYILINFIIKCDTPLDDTLNTLNCLFYFIHNSPMIRDTRKPRSRVNDAYNIGRFSSVLVLPPTMPPPVVAESRESSSPLPVDDDDPPTTDVRFTTFISASLLRK